MSFPATARKERVIGKLFLSVRMHTCSPKVHFYEKSVTAEQIQPCNDTRV